jgi:hypothetical protein
MNETFRSILASMVILLPLSATKFSYQLFPHAGEEGKGSITARRLALNL